MFRQLVGSIIASNGYIDVQTEFAYPENDRGFSIPYNTVMIQQCMGREFMFNWRPDNITTIIDLDTNVCFNGYLDNDVPDSAWLKTLEARETYTIWDYINNHPTSWVDDDEVYIPLIGLYTLANSPITDSIKGLFETMGAPNYERNCNLFYAPNVTISVMELFERKQCQRIKWNWRDSKFLLLEYGTYNQLASKKWIEPKYKVDAEGNEEVTPNLCLEIPEPYMYIGPKPYDVRIQIQAEPEYESIFPFLNIKRTTNS